MHKARLPRERDSELVLVAFKLRIIDQHSRNLSASPGTYIHTRPSGLLYLIPPHSYFKWEER